LNSFLAQLPGKLELQSDGKEVAHAGLNILRAGVRYICTSIST